jgi:hypothetical protein
VRPSSSCLPKGVAKSEQAAPEGGSPGFSRRPQDFGRDGGPGPTRPVASPIGIWPGAASTAAPSPSAPASRPATKSAGGPPSSALPSSSAPAESSPASSGEPPSLWRFGGWDRRRWGRRRKWCCWWWRWRREHRRHRG